MSNTIDEQIDRILKHLPNARITVNMTDGVGKITEIDIDGKQSRARDREACEVREAINEARGYRDDIKNY